MDLFFQTRELKSCGKRTKIAYRIYILTFGTILPSQDYTNVCDYSTPAFELGLKQT